MDERGLPAAGDARDDGQAAFGQIDVDIFQVIDSGASHFDEVVAIGCVHGGVHFIRSG
ncbi:hypothetical protein [Bowdeniella massiliensis]|uniref:hypothetical protein n=1 Tax=Bowdeniella massiliensis TaxID=2932264 RepID=UPI002029755E|nr:hypothetical protein [Bowdeniella massiliensis]